MVAQLVMPAEAAMDVGAFAPRAALVESSPVGITAGTIRLGEAPAGIGADMRGRAGLAGAALPVGIIGTTEASTLIGMST